MVISKKLQDAINAQINAELYSSYLYLSMAAWFGANNLGGFSSWMREQAREEVEHAMKFYGYVIERGGRVKLDKVEAPPADFESAYGIYRLSYEHEQKVTGLIHDLLKLAQKEDDPATVELLQWYVKEQVEEEASASGYMEKLAVIKDNPGLVFMLDAQAGKRGN